MPRHAYAHTGTYADRDGDREEVTRTTARGRERSVERGVTRREKEARRPKEKWSKHPRRSKAYRTNGSGGGARETGVFRIASRPPPGPIRHES